ncbi:hypothetical protein ASPTUDRAFT_42249, partial [Aspergillus tubingensis CBS 134.48]
MTVPNLNDKPCRNKALRRPMISLNSYPSNPSLMNIKSCHEEVDCHCDREMVDKLALGPPLERTPFKSR